MVVIAPGQCREACSQRLPVAIGAALAPLTLEPLPFVLQVALGVGLRASGATWACTPLTTTELPCLLVVVALFVKQSATCQDLGKLGSVWGGGVCMFACAWGLELVVDT